MAVMGTKIRGSSGAARQPDRLPQWNALHARALELRATHLRKLYELDPTRAVRLSLYACGIHLDYSKQRVDDTVLSYLLQIAEQQQVGERRDAMFAGE